jgi:hypothetical protein
MTSPPTARLAVAVRFLVGATDFCFGIVKIYVAEGIAPESRAQAMSWTGATWGTASHGRCGHSQAPLYISYFVIIHTKQTGWYENDLTVHLGQASR